MNVRQIGPQSVGRSLTVRNTFDELTQALGEPNWVAERSDKLDVDWHVKDFDTGRTLSVWNYKNGPNYKGEDGTPVEEIEKWSASGDKSLAEDLGLNVEPLFS